MESPGEGRDSRPGLPRLRLDLSIGDPSWPVYWKPDGRRFIGKPTSDRRPTDWLSLCSESTLKLVSGRSYPLRLASNRPVQLREGSGRWSLREVDASGNLIEMPLPAAAAAGLAADPRAGLSAADPLSAAPAWSQTDGGGGGTAAAAGTAAAEGEGGLPLAWSDAGSGANRSVYAAQWLCSLEPTASGRRQYLVLSAYVEDFGWVECPVQIKVYSRTDKNARGSFSLRFIQYELRGDSSDRAALLAVNFHRY